MIDLLRKYAAKLLFSIGYLILSVSWSNAQTVGFYFERDRNHIALPMELYQNLIVIPGFLNEKYPMNFILDTGLRPAIIINKEFADALEIEYQGKVQLFGIGNDVPVEAMIAKPVSISFPGVKSAGLAALVLQEDILQLEQHLGIVIHGIIGYDLFSRFVVEINYAKKKIKLYEPTAFRPKKRYIPTELELIDGKPVASLTVRFSASDSMQAKLLVDTGASHALVLHQHASDHIVLPEKYIETKLGRGLAGEINGYLGRIDGINFGNEELTGVITSFPRQTVYNLEGRQLRHGSLGGELLKKYTVIFNFVKSRMYVKPNASLKYPFEYNMSGLEFIAAGKNLHRFVITEIRSNSAASGVGFKPGDILVSLNSIPARELDLTKIYMNLNLKVGKKVKMTVYRDGKYISGAFRLKREI